LAFCKKYRQLQYYVGNTLFVDAGIFISYFCQVCGELLSFRDFAKQSNDVAPQIGLN
jgi:hypothetical protein